MVSREWLIGFVCGWISCMVGWIAGTHLFT